MITRIGAGGVIWRTGFSVNPTLQGFPRPSAVAEQIVKSPSYYFEGRLRKGDHYLFEYSISGEGIFWDGDGEHRVPAGSGFLCRVTDPATGYRYPKDGRHVWRLLFFTFRGCDEMARQLLDRFGPIYAVPLDSALMRQLRGYRRYADSTVDLTPSEGCAIATGLLGSLADVGAAKLAETSHGKLVQEARRIVAAHLEENFQVADLAAELGVTAEHLSRIYRRETGSTPLAYLTREKIRHACELLQDTTLSCKEVHARLGYDNASHFARTFRRVTGITPSEFRKRGGPPVV